MKIIQTKLAGVFIIEPVVIEDQRGFFMESYSKKKHLELQLDHDFIQDNHSLSVPVGTLRGLHYQLSPKAQTKLVRVITGSIYDVAVDIRKGSATYGEWTAVTLSAANKLQLLIPKGFAHGFCTLEADTQVVYKVDEYYSAPHDRGICWNDPTLAIDWPCLQPLLSDKDRNHPTLRAMD